MRLLTLVVCLAVLTPLWALSVSSVTPAVPSTAGSSFQPPAMDLLAGTARMGAVHFSVRAYAPLDLTVQQIAASLSNDFKPFDEGTTYKLSSDTALWLHFRVLNNAPKPENWSLVLSKPFIDRAEFYSQDAQGVWRMQLAGSRVPHQQWPIRALTPQFQLPDLSQTSGSASDAGYRDYFLRVQKWIPLRFAAYVQRTDRVGEETQRAFLAIGLMLGLFSFMVVFSSVLFLVYRNTAYVWYAAYAGAALMASASFSGMGAYVFWPVATNWTVISTIVFVLLGMTAQLGFTRAMFVAPNSSRLWRTVSTAALGLLLVAVALFLAVDTAQVRIALFNSGLVGGFAIIGVLVVRALRHERQVAGLYLLSFVPMLLVMMLTQIEQLGMAALPWLPYFAPLFGLLFELPVLLLALHLHAKKGHALTVQSKTLAQTDPLTGFIASALYFQTLTSMWESARGNGVDLTVVYVKVMGLPAGSVAKAEQGTDRATLRTVRTLRTVARENDSIARVDHQIFVILMPGISLSERLVGKLSRLVALGLMVDPDDPSSSPVKFKIIAASLRSFSSNSRALDAAVKLALAPEGDAPFRVIQFIGKRAGQPVLVKSSAW